MAYHHGNFGELAEAVFAGDLARAEAVLDQMQREGDKDEAIRRAKRRARPELAPKIVTRRETFPVAGHLPGSLMGCPRLSEDEPADPAERLLKCGSRL